MFTGIIEEVGEVRDVMLDSGGSRVQVACSFVDQLQEGQSVSVSGVCLTVESTGTSWFEVFLSRETREKTSFGDISVGERVNLERAMSVGGRFDGHFVQGHVDTVTEVVGVSSVGDDWEFVFRLPDGIARYVVEKGSVAVDGISLTVASVNEDSFRVAVIPTTWEETGLSEKQEGDAVNLEVDVIAKYVERLVAGYQVESPS